MNREVFFEAIKKPLFGGIFTTNQVHGLDAILDAFERAGESDATRLSLHKQAYMLATVFHETAATMQPIREAKAASDDEAIARLDKAFAKGQLTWVKSPYWRKDKDGKAWFGRGLVQITHKFNYEKIGKAIGVDLLANPALALTMDVAIRIMITGMIKGIFTGKNLDTYLDDVDEGDAEDFREFVNARRIINGTDRATLVASHALKFETALKGASA